MTKIVLAHELLEAGVPKTQIAEHLVRHLASHHHSWTQQLGRLSTFQKSYH